MADRRKRLESTVINGARQLDAAIGCWAIENGLGPGDKVELRALAAYVKSGSEFERELLASKSPTDALGNPYIILLTLAKPEKATGCGSANVMISEKTKKALGSVATDWGGY